jgi:hypothetical protein
VWHSDLSGALGYADWATDVAIDAAGDVVALGRIWHFNLGDPPFGIDVVKLAGADGSTIWQDAIAATGQWALSIPKEIALDADGNVLAVGDTEQMCTNNDYAVVRLDGGDGSGMDNDLLPTTCLLSAKSLRVRDRHPDRQRLVLKSKHLGDRSIAWHSRIPIPSSGVLGADPTIYGATLEVVNRASGESTIIPLPASNWSATERTPTIGFRETVEYQDRQGVLGPCQRVRLRPQQRTTLDAKCKGAIGLSLDEPSQGQLMLRLTLGGPVKARYCMEFGGDVKKDQAGAFVARSALAPTDCD